MSRETSRSLLISILVILGLCTLAYLGVILGRQRQERKNMGYLGQLGGVPATYEAVEAYLNREFRPGMTREEVISLLDKRFLYRFRYKSNGAAKSFSDTIMFPDGECDPEAFQRQECHVVLFRFDYENGRLVRVQLEDSV